MSRRGECSHIDQLNVRRTSNLPFYQIQFLFRNELETSSSKTTPKRAEEMQSSIDFSDVASITRQNLTQSEKDSPRFYTLDVNARTFVIARFDLSISLSLSHCVIEKRVMKTRDPDRLQQNCVDKAAFHSANSTGAKFRNSLVIS